MRQKLMIEFLRLLPKNGMSRWMGKLAQVRFPAPIMRRIITGFARWFKIDLMEAKRPVGDFLSLQEFFIRELRPQVRPMDPRPDSFISPCDGFWGQSGRVSVGELFQVKGKSYALASLLGDEGLARRFEGGEFATLYLSPKDYHRFHMPMSGDLLEATYLPGYLWPVNAAAVKYVDQLFCVNERMVMTFRPEKTSGQLLAIVAVGATMVGKVKVRFDDSLITNDPRQTPVRRQYEARQIHFNRGDELGHFEFGSTLVVVATPGLVKLAPQAIGTPVRLGQGIGTM